MSFYNSVGEMNALSTKDALNGIVKMARILEENQSANSALAGRPSLTDQAKDDMIKRALLSTDGKVALNITGGLY